MESGDRYADIMLKEEMRKLNSHLPKNRQTLKELLREETPSVSAVDGRKIIMKKSEIEEFAVTIPEELQSRISLPLVFLRRTELGPGVYVLLGGSEEEFALSRIVKGYRGDYQEFKDNGSNRTLFYKPEISELVRRFHSLIVIGFGISQRDNV